MDKKDVKFLVHYFVLYIFIYVIVKIKLLFKFSFSGTLVVSATFLSYNGRGVFRGQVLT